MLVLSLAYDGDEDFIEDIEDIRILLKEKNIHIGVSESLEGDTHFIKIYSDEGENSKIINLIQLYVSNIIYRLVVDTYKSGALFDYLNDTFFFLKHDEILETEEKIMKTLYGREMIKDENSIYCYNRINEIIEKIRLCMEENHEININGFLTFRMKELAYDIERIIDKTVEKYLIEKEYKEFIKLLKYFVDTQESKIEEVNLIIEGDGIYKIKESKGENLYNEFIKEIGVSRIEENVSMEDIIISGLITNSPKIIVIHKRENCNNKEFIETIEKVFIDRIRYCKKCKLCICEKIKIKK
ncbi:MAG: putative sporulation protein YtxC [Clostridiaceae bacterium]